MSNSYSVVFKGRTCLTLLIAALGVTLAPLALAGAKEDKRAENATRVLQAIQDTPDARVPEQLLREAHAIAVFPDVVKAGLVFGGRHGRGLVSVRAQDGAWSNPVYVSLTGGSFGWQAGLQAADIVLVFRSAKGVDSLVNGKFTLGADAAVAAGPVGRQAQAGTDTNLDAEIFSYSRARGLFAGLAIDGSVISIDYGANERVYGEKTTPRMLFENRVSTTPAGVVSFRDELEEQTQ